MATSTKPWVEKYRPHNLSQVVSHAEVVCTLANSMKSGSMPHMLFHGPPGVGKTTVALAFCKELFKDLWRERVLEMNASDERGIDVVRGKIKHFCSLAVPTGPGLPPPIKVIILDEADQMTSDAQGALRRLMETCSGHTRFMILCNYVSKLISPIQSRCMKYHFDPLPCDLVSAHLQYVCNAENISIEPAALQRLIEISGGDMRRNLTWLQMTHQLVAGQKISLQCIEEVMGLLPTSEAEQLWNAIQKARPLELASILDNLICEGYNVMNMVRLVQERVLTADLNEYQLVEAMAQLGQMEGNIVNKCNDGIQAQHGFGKVRDVMQATMNPAAGKFIPPIVTSK
eukprot:GEMP01037467.1.p1 GENE.GEMP01037467.1~~GEMP01037467.1.p1  ORF type:complete len:343 (+),score=93.29 GEMP01037467.1:46-1074(+)